MASVLEDQLAQERGIRERLADELRARDAALARRLDDVAEAQAEHGERLGVIYTVQLGEDDLAGVFWALWLILVGTLLQAAAAAFG